MRADADRFEAEWFWKWSCALREARRNCPNGDSEEIEDCMDEIESLALHAKNGAVRTRCYALLASNQATAEDASA